MSRRSRILALVAAALRYNRAHGNRGQAARYARADKALRRPLAPRPYGLTTRNGQTIDNLTHYALYAVERALGYDLGSLAVVQGSYKAGNGAAASAGTHDGGGVVDLTAQEHARKVRALRDVGFAAWYRPAIPGLWGAHVHAVLIGNARLAPEARGQVTDYAAGLDGLATRKPDPNPYRPSPLPRFKMPTYRETP